MSVYETESRHSSESQHDNFRLALAHSPDAFDWAQREGVHLLLAGHTHGGQVRLPGIGPIVAPSWYGSKFASGVFYRKPTLMHVSRGLAGVHPLRFRCAPEIAILELHSSHSSLPGNFAEQR
jgi:predicted MPP superfamily phosphohydrolase